MLPECLPIGMSIALPITSIIKEHELAEKNAKTK
jgi:hypothetical protein